MSYDLRFFKRAVHEAVDIDLLGDEEEEGKASYRDQLELLGTAEEVTAILRTIFPEAEFEHFEAYHEGYLMTEDYGVTFFWPESEAVRVLDVAVTGSENAFAVIQTLHERTGWRAADEVEIDFNGDPASGLRYWAGTLDTLRRQVGSNKKWWQFWK
ncbi:hypothetical protein GZH47_09510 [Paenibacillus rhizovicinus]|uniref:Uncharacterized protein n=1 Tax=Paenibacillus rhizovicinus TaxID=2704463 RepID=A0A6C0NXX9_9BACL|nr:hypothetical protein [Paenibacillus rhizovicinus]QHW31067.1 hypothetical protein GZH47_09510 [Paenibacillus rhizovicinus]